MTRPEYAYIQARLQARHGNLPGLATWRSLEASHTPGHYLTLARAGVLAPWVEGQGHDGDPHRIEQQLRWRWRRYVDEVASWQPTRWRPATRWFGGLSELPLIQARADEGDAVHWLDTWLRLMPAGDAPPALLQRLATLLMPGLPPGAGRGRAEAARRRGAQAESVRAALLKLWRHHAASPVAVFAHLALVALDVERLRGGIVTRTLFDPTEGLARKPAGA